MKILIILLIVIALFAIISSFILKKVRNFFKPISDIMNNQNPSNPHGPQKGEEVVYNKDNVVIMKGEAGRKNKSEKG